MLAMVQALKQLRNVEVINFGDCLVRCEGAIALAGVLRDGLPVLKELNLSFGEITEAAALVVARAAMEKPHMEKVDLNGNCLGEEGCEALREAMENMDKADMLASLSDDEGEPDDDDDDDDEEDEEDDDDSESSDDDDATDDCDELSEEDDEPVKENGIINKEDSPEKPQGPAEVMAFLSCPSVEKLLQLGDMRTTLQQQMDASDPHKAADALLKITSLYSEEPETRAAVFEAMDAMLMKLLSASALQSYCFLSTLLVKMGLLKGEGKMKTVPLVPGQLLCLEHATQQEYFSQHHASLLHTFTSRNSGALKSCSATGERLRAALEKKCNNDH